MTTQNLRSKGRVTSQLPPLPVSSHYDNKMYLIMAFLVTASIAVRIASLFVGPLDYTVTIETYWLGIDVFFERQYA